MIFDGEGNEGKRMTIKKNYDLLDNARQLRKVMTPQERKLWYLFLKDYPVKIYKQRIIGSYIVDFYCAAAKLVIEVDGTQHFEQTGISLDQERDAYLRGLELRILRFSNREIDLYFDRVCEAIRLHIENCR